jgi:anti-sigma factor RsiW
MNQRDLELLSAYLDGELKPSDSTRLEARLATDPQLASVLRDLRATRSLLRKLPARKAPRNFTLTRKMVGQNPPLPRTYPIFRFATALATLLFVFSFGVNTVGRQMASQTQGFGMGGGGGNAGEESTELFSVQEAPAAAPAAATEAPVLEMAPMPTQMSTEAADAARIVDTPVAKNTGETENAVEQPDQFQVPQEAQSPAPLVSSVWQIGLAVVAAIGVLLMFLMQRIAMSRWRKE